MRYDFCYLKCVFLVSEKSVKLNRIEQNGNSIFFFLNKSLSLEFKKGVIKKKIIILKWQVIPTILLFCQDSQDYHKYKSSAGLNVLLSFYCCKECRILF